MKPPKFWYVLIIPVMFVFFGCATEDFEKEIILQSEFKEEINAPTRSSLKPIGSGVMMQAFYWNVPSGGTWWDTVSGKV